MEYVFMFYFDPLKHMNKNIQSNYVTVYGLLACKLIRHSHFCNYGLT